MDTEILVFPGPTLEMYAASVRQHDRLDPRQAEPGPALAAASGPPGLL